MQEIKVVPFEINKFITVSARTDSGAILFQLTVKIPGFSQLYLTHNC